jgi:peptidoglycan/LPS O-acetylase OafA/YrhL
MRNLNTIRNRLSAQIADVPDYLQSKNYPALIGIRGLAIIFVLLYHLGINHFLRHVGGWLFGEPGFKDQATQSLGS